MVICLGRGADLHMAQMMPLPITISYSSKPRWVLPDGSAFLVPAYSGCPGKRPLNECSNSSSNSVCVKKAQFLADRTIGRAYGTVCRLSSVCRL